MPETAMRARAVALLCACAWPLATALQQAADAGTDDVCHCYPDWGAVDSKLVRKSPAHYEDGVYLMAETNRFSEKKQMSRKWAR